GPLLGEKEVFRDLHSDGATTRLDAAGRDQLQGRTGQASEVDAVVLEKTTVLRRQKSVQESLGRLFNSDRSAPFFTKLCDQLVIGGINAKGRLQFDVFQLLR